MSLSISKSYTFKAFTDNSGTIYRQLKQRDALKDTKAIRDLVQGDDGSVAVKWYVPVGTMIGSEAECERIAEGLKTE